MSSGDDNNNCAENFNEIVYNYFTENHGKVDNITDNEKELILEYKDCSKQQLKSELKKQKKGRNATSESIRYASKLLRSRIKPPSPESLIMNLSTDHDQEISKNSWHYCKKFIEIPSHILPEFNKQKCNKYFRKSSATVNPTKLFAISDWIPKFNDPSVKFDLSPPTYNKICKIVKRMKASGSPCPLDQISILCFKRSSILRSSFVLEICKEVLRRKSIPKSWQRAATILIYKKGDKSDPSNFRPITLEPVILKIFTSFLRDRVFEFLQKNKNIETSIQKGFTPGLRGTFESIANMAHIINDARRRQRSVPITLIDLQNACSEVHHNLIESVLKYHHIPDDVISIIRSLYSDFHITIFSDY